MSSFEKYTALVLAIVCALLLLILVSTVLPRKATKEVLVLSTFQTIDELGYEWYVIQYLADGNLEQVNCNSLEQVNKVKSYLGVE
jgi:hypothetical protein